MKPWILYLIAGAMMLHPHLYQKLEMLYNYFTHPEYQFWTTFSGMDFFDLLLHGGLPLVLIAIGVKKQFGDKKND